MSTYRELTYLVLDQIKGLSDDFTYTEDHIIFLLDKYRASILKQTYSKSEHSIPDSNYQNICLDLMEVPAISGEPCEGGSYLRSVEEIPEFLDMGHKRITSMDHFQGEFTYVTRDRMRYVGHNKYLKNMIYASDAPDEHLYFKSSNINFLHLAKIQLTAIFQDAARAAELSCSESKECDLLDRSFPMEEALIASLIQFVLKDLLGATYRPEDDSNNASDDLANLATFLRNNVKTDLQKKIDGQ